MYSLNQDKSAVAIIERLGLLDTAAPPRALPFRPRMRARHEAVRPVYWANRSKSYVQRTQHWERVPAHAWAEARCASRPPLTSTCTLSANCFVSLPDHLAYLTHALHGHMSTSLFAAALRGDLSACCKC